METKIFIQEKLELHKKQTVTNAIMNKASNHLFDAYRELEMAIQYCDNPEIRERLESIKEMLGCSQETSGSMESTEPTVISHLQKLMGDYSSK
jgi:hypothetical protein